MGSFSNNIVSVHTICLAQYGQVGSCAIKPESTNQKNPDASAVTCPKPSDSTAKASPPITNLPIPSSPSVAPSALKPFETTKPNSVDTQLLPMAVLPPLEKQLLQSRESDTDAEMSSSSSEEDALEYMSEYLEDSLAVISPLPSSKPKKQTNTKTGGYGCPNPEVPRDLYSLPVYPPLCLLLSADPFHPSTASEGALHERLLPLCLLLASHGQPKTPRVGRAWHPIRRVVHFGPRCINRLVSQSHGWSAQGDQAKGSFSGAWR
ncbi:hypothetical protein AVEN_85398-1 [Araneus ventricosus]|uniref:Uncharacterized protein n=1 Tax=Araneus ventricosus TaxID=182803 RepID=A0A4Y2TUG1_ARAVE|nr:hypothetical protein AVEN_85398-1 [Araneus ventricosus]